MTPSNLKPQSCAIYARVSTQDQHCDQQLSELRAYAERMHWDVISEYVDRGESGAKRNRPALLALMADARMHKWDIVAVWKIDRFGRSLQDLVANINELDNAGIRFVAPTQGIDTDQRSPAGRLLMHIMAAFAEFERDLIRERTMAGLQRARQAGRRGGRPAKVFRRDLAQDMRDHGVSWRVIAARLGVAQSTIRKALSIS